MAAVGFLTVSVLPVEARSWVIQIIVLAQVCRPTTETQVIPAEESQLPEEQNTIIEPGEIHLRIIRLTTAERIHSKTDRAAGPLQAIPTTLTILLRHRRGAALPHTTAVVAEVLRVQVQPVAEATAEAGEEINSKIQ